MLLNGSSTTDLKTKQLFITWVPFQRRSLSMQAFFGYEFCSVGFSFRNRAFRGLEYFIKCFYTFILLIRKQPDVLWIQLPPNFLLHLAHLYKRVFNPRLLIVADSHNATFRKPWIDILGTRTLLNHCNSITVHNTWVRSQAIELGLKSAAIVVLEDPPATIQASDAPAWQIHRPWLVCPCSFNRDEPIQVIIEAAQLAPDLTFILTGNPERARGIHDLSKLPDNVILTGFLAAAEFDQLLFGADAILGFTRLDGIQLSVANEALGVCKPIVLSNTNTLKTLFYKGAIYVDSNDPNEIAQGCYQAIQQTAQLSQAISELRREREAAWLIQATDVQQALTV
ncbi:glycosyltransferase [Leptolyngbya sp. UWPOB_LEPTO1]|uniref:glycosyltransferase n=1 Tax=Leptolyngbya sp. UWPOB_LEPTO1 TaxID=2815653 RepID=UPI00257D871F|nr:glycosyltransferase [Leptolyngbya sp. UWPOB_LEPTO1]